MCVCICVCVSVFATPVAYNLLSRHAASLRYPVDFTPHPLARPALLRYYKWLWNIYKHHKFNLCRHCARRRVYCAHNKRSSPASPSPTHSTPLLSSGPPPPASHSYPAIEVIYYFYTFRVSVSLCVCVCLLCLTLCVCVFLWHAFYTLHIKYSAKIAVAIIFIYYIIFLRRAMWICVVSDKYVSFFLLFGSVLLMGVALSKLHDSKLCFKLRNLWIAALCISFTFGNCLCYGSKCSRNEWKILEYHLCI